MGSKLIDRDIEMLDDLGVACRNYLQVTGSDWVRPLDCGGSNGSDHSYRLSKLVKYGYAERKRRGGYTRGSWQYRINDNGIRYLGVIKGRRK